MHLDLMQLRNKRRQHFPIKNNNMFVCAPNTQIFRRPPSVFQRFVAAAPERQNCRDQKSHGIELGTGSDVACVFMVRENSTFSQLNAGGVVYVSLTKTHSIAKNNSFW